MPTVHTSPFSGAWYPGEPAALESLLDEAFERSRQRTGPFLFPDGLGYVVPHAGPQYSGTVAAAVYLHGLAGQIGARALGEKCLIATDILEYLPDAMEECADVSHGQ